MPRGTRYRCEPIAKQQRLPGGRGKIVWVRPFAYKAPTVTYIYLVRGLAEPPILLGSDAYYSRASVTWSKDGKTITVKSNSPDRSFVLDVEKGERTPLPADANTPSP